MGLDPFRPLMPYRTHNQLIFGDPKGPFGLCQLNISFPQQLSGCTKRLAQEYPVELISIEI